MGCVETCHSHTAYRRIVAPACVPNARHDRPRSSQARGRSNSRAKHAGNVPRGLVAYPLCGVGTILRHLFDAMNGMYGIPVRAVLASGGLTSACLPCFVHRALLRRLW